MSKRFIHDDNTPRKLIVVRYDKHLFSHECLDLISDEVIRVDLQVDGGEANEVTPEELVGKIVTIEKLISFSWTAQGVKIT